MLEHKTYKNSNTFREHHVKTRKKKYNKLIRKTPNVKINHTITQKKTKRKLSIKKQQKAGSKTEAINKIGKIIKSSKLFLNIVCQNSGACTAFGTHTSKLNNFFSGFTDFKYVLSPIKKIGNDSVNGIVNEIEYERDGYKAFAVLKTANNKTSDNLTYEYVVGIKFINRIMTAFPCFVETYGLYYNKLTNNMLLNFWKVNISSDAITLDESDELLSELSLQNNTDFNKACAESDKISILIQHIQNAYSLGDMLTDYFIVTELVYVLFIVYQALSVLREKFTHYDLHLGNVLIYIPDPNKYIVYNYHEADGNIISFKCPYIPKIIDYGRSFFDNGNVNSHKIYNHLCGLPNCGQDCGGDNGFAFMPPPPNPDPGSSYYISTSQKNESHDLRLLINLKNKKNIMKLNTNYSAIKMLLNSVVYGVGINDLKNKKFGTIENTQISSDKIYNVEGAYIALKKIVVSQTYIDRNIQKNRQKEKLGDFHIYADQRPMIFVKVPAKNV
jgi:hypothetical protein